MSEEKICHCSLSEAVYRKLLRGILDGKYPAGSRLREEQLCRGLGVSRTPVREALIRLAREGILEQQPRCGCIVRQRSLDEFRELLECRQLLECLVLRRWFGNIDRNCLEELRKQLENAQAGDTPEFRNTVLNVDEKLHALILEACSNHFMAEQLRILQLQCRPYRVLRCAESLTPQAIKNERLNIINAILNNQIDKAAQDLAEHFESSIKYYLQ
ncbi:MAG: GntR family transcriptional regulator [Victivallales bacterium]|nr:GntR family transcriptional regulator [Victivallales bacterium]